MANSVSLLWLLSFAPNCIAAPPAQHTIQFGAGQAELAIEGQSAFRISISYAGTPSKISSRMIAAHESSANCSFHKDADSLSITASFGQVRVTTKGDFQLVDKNGKVLIKSPLISSFNGSSLKIDMGIPPTATKSARKYYGAGNKPGAGLTVNNSHPSVGNDYGEGQWSWAPQYFSPADAYAALAVGTLTLPRSDPSSLRCVGDTTGRVDCGYDGIDEPKCKAKGCCWGPNNENLPWCYEKTGPSMSSYPAAWDATVDGVTWTIEGAAADIYLMPAADAYEFRRKHAELTGAPRILPRYAFGFLAGRWGWKDRADIEDKLRRFRSGNFPIDGFISDFEWFTTSNDYGLPPTGSSDYTDFGYDPKLFDSPQQQLATYHSWGFKFGGIRKPRLGNTNLLDTARSKGWLVPGGVDGKDRNLNFSIPAMRQWYAGENQHYLKDGVDFWWNDEGEVYYFMFDEWNEALRSGFEKNDSEHRYFSLNRAFTPGMQRHGLAVWTGDISVSWQSLAQQPEAQLNLQLMGMPYVGCDTGGFKGGNDTPELLTRWYQLSVFMTVMRVHSNEQDVPHFPFLYGDAAAAAMRKALEMRYRLIPLLYSLAHHAFTDGAPIARPLFMEFGSDPAVSNVHDQWLIGSGLMAAPIITPGGSRKVYLPGGSLWYGFNTTDVRPLAGRTTVSVDNATLDTIPVYCRAGAIIPLAPVLQHTGMLPGGVLEVKVYAGADGSFTMVEDDGDTNSYETGAVRRTIFTYSDKDRTFSWKAEGTYYHPSMFEHFQVSLFTASGGVESAEVRKLGTSGQMSFSTIVV